MKKLATIFAVLVIAFMTGCAAQSVEERDRIQIVKTLDYPYPNVAMVINDVVKELDLGFERTVTVGVGVRVYFAGGSAAPGRGDPGDIMIQPRGDTQTVVTITAGRRGGLMPGPRPDKDPVLAAAMFEKIDEAVRAQASKR